MKKYKAKAIIRALKNPKTRNTYSLRAPLLSPIIESEQKKLTTENNELSKPIERAQGNTFRKNKIKNNILSKLEDMDDEHKS